MTAAEKASETKPCGFCKRPIQRGERRKERWVSLQFCDHRCAALHRGKLMGGWKTTPKTCKLCLENFLPTPGIRKNMWRLRRYCSGTCAVLAGMGETATRQLMLPDECTTPGLRAKFLRLATSADGRKKKLAVFALSRKAGISPDTLDRIEDGRAVIVKWQPLVCGALKVPEKLLTCDMKTWMEQVGKYALTAYELRKTETK